MSGSDRPASITVLGQRRALGELDATISRIERARREQLALAARLAAAGEDPAPIRALLRLTDDYLACLRESRVVLLWKLPQDVDQALGAMPAAAMHHSFGAAGARPRLVE
jgi:hypothetical protein